MKEKTKKVFRQLEKQRREIIDLYDSLPRNQLLYRPKAGQWNLLQVMRHLVTAEQQSLIYIKRKLIHAETSSRTGIGASIRHLLLKMALYSPLKFKAPKVAEVGEEAPDLDEMKAEWDAVRDEFRTIIEENSADTLTKAVYKHPRAGLLNVKQALEFMEAHISHHQKQMERLIKN